MTDPFCQLTTLIVDPDPMFRQVVSANIALLGITNIHLAADSSAAISVLGASSCHLIVFDFDQSCDQAHEMLAFVRSDPRLQATITIAMSYSALRGVNLNAIREGADGVLVKPFSRLRLEQVICDALLGPKARRAPLVFLPSHLQHRRGRPDDLGHTARRLATPRTEIMPTAPKIGAASGRGRWPRPD